MRKIRLAIAGIVLLGAAGLAAGCSNQLNDQGGVPQASADYEITYLNVSGFPNITLVCIRGAGFATITRDYNSVTRVPEWDAFCASKQVATPRAAPAASSSGQ